jgi:hypothetical protein
MTRYYLSRRGVIHQAYCGKRGPAPEWEEASAYTLRDFVLAMRRAKGRIRWCGYCQPGPARIPAHKRVHSL